MGQGLTKVCKIYGKMTTKGDGKTINWVYDYANDRPRKKGEMTPEEVKASNKARKVWRNTQ